MIGIRKHGIPNQWNCKKKTRQICSKL